MTLLERDGLLGALQEQLQRAMSGKGGLVFVEGEAGIGKSSLLRVFADRERGRLPVLAGACDALHTPRPLAPLHDIAAESGGELRHALEDGADRLRAFGLLLELLAARPTLLLLEDLHWADEATLDLLRFLGRRIGRTPSLVVATLRNDELGPAHPLRLVLGDLATSGTQRLSLPPLSPAAVRSLAQDRDIDPGELHRLTGGNPFYVTEVLAAGGAEVPATVSDAVLARAARLRSSARALLDAAAVAGPRIEPWLLAALAGAEGGAVEECLATGILREDEGLLAFRHELGRQAVLAAMSPTRRLSLHRMVLQSLLSPGVPKADAARLAHHAEGAEDPEAVLRFAVVAAREASARGAHRQAAQQLARALAHAPVDPAPRGALLDDHAVELHLSGEIQSSIAGRRAARECWRESGRMDREAASLARMAHLLVLDGRNAGAETALREARQLLEPGAESPAAVEVRRWSAYVRMLDRDVEEAVREGEAAMDVAARLGDDVAVIQCLNTIGAARIVSGAVEAGVEDIERSLAMARAAGSDQWVSTAYTNLGSGCGEAYRFDLAEPYLRDGIEYAGERDLDHARLYCSAWLATVQLYRGHWEECARTAHAVVADRRSSGVARMMASIALGRLRARRGDPGAWDALDAALALVDRTGTLQRVAPMRAARAEAAWLEGRDAAAAEEAGLAVELALRKRHAWFASELLFWRGRAGAAAPSHGGPAKTPFALELAGQWREAAAAWTALGCPWEAARALADGDEPGQREALAAFEALGSAPMVERVKRRLRAAGVRGLRRGPRETTRGNPQGLTKKEIAVLALAAEGLRNKEIAQRLSRSVRTIDHHLAAIFAKLGASSRAEAVSAAYRIGVVKPPAAGRR